MRLTVSLVVLCASCFIVSCASGGVTKLGAGFDSYVTVSDAHNRLKQAGLSSKWKEESQALPQSDPRPPYHFLIMSGPFTLSGIEGRLKLVFYNDRLMSTEFSTTQGPAMIAVMRQQNGTVPNRPSQDITLDRRTKFRYDVDPDGTFRFNWLDAKLEEEWLKWVGSNS